MSGPVLEIGIQLIGDLKLRFISYVEWTKGQMKFRQRGWVATKQPL